MNIFSFRNLFIGIIISICILFIAYKRYPSLFNGSTNSRNGSKINNNVLSENSIFKGTKAACFKSITHPTSLQQLSYTGNFPEWLQGKLLATGPGLFEVGKTEAAYWFNGLAVVHGIYFDAKNIEYHNHFLDSLCYKRCIKNGKLDSEMSREKSKGFFSRLASAALATPEPYDNGNLAIAKINNSFIALTETTLGVEIDPKTLDTIKSFNLNNYFDGHLTTSQFLYDRFTKNWYNYAINFGTTSSYVLYKIGHDSSAQVITTYATKTPSYMRSFAMTKNYIILIEIPFVINPMDLLLGSGTFIEKIRWKPNLGTKFLIFNKEDGALVTTLTIDNPFLIFTIANAYENSDTITIDVVTYANAAIIPYTKLEALQSNDKPEFEPSRAIRFSLNLKNKTVTHNKLCTPSIESPTINQNYSMENYNYIYGLGSSHPYKFPHQIIKFAITTGETLIWQEDGCYANKPTFVPAPNAKSEDDGVILSFVTNSLTNSSFLIILDAATFKELARAEIPCMLPLGVVGIFSFDA